MHIPDGFLDAKTSIATYVLSSGSLSYALYRAKDELEEKKVPLLGITAAFIFAAQMLNFPVAGGTSGHFLGAILAMTLLGPWTGFLVIFIVLLVQCLFFADGGLTALGANVFNMAVVGGLLAFYLMTLARKVVGALGERGSLLASVAFFSWLSVVLASAACALELGISRTVSYGAVFPAMVGVHSIIGIGEAIITAVVVSIVMNVRPDLVHAFRPAHLIGSPEEGVA